MDTRPKRGGRQGSAPVEDQGFPRISRGPTLWFKKKEKIYIYSCHATEKQVPRETFTEVQYMESRRMVSCQEMLL